MLADDQSVDYYSPNAIKDMLASSPNDISVLSNNQPEARLLKLT